MWRVWGEIIGTHAQDEQNVEKALVSYPKTSASPMALLLSKQLLQAIQNQAMSTTSYFRVVLFFNDDVIGCVIMVSEQEEL